MAKRGFVSKEEARRQLEKIGFGRAAISVRDFLFVEGQDVRKASLGIVEKVAKELGPEIAAGLILEIGRTSAYRQLSHNRFSRVNAGLKSMRDQFLYIATAFSPRLRGIAKNPALERAGCSMSLGISIDAPFSLAFELHSGKETVGRFNFDLLFNRQGKPSAILGNLQGGSRKEVEEFKRKAGKSPLDFFVGCFKTAFPRRQLLALNPRKHGYLEGINLFALSNSMRERGLLTEAEHRQYQGYLDKGRTEGSKKKQAIAKVEVERQRILTQTPGMHAAAYKKAGFRRTRSRIWRLPRKPRLT
ncbi:MAG: hypothetical protein WC634_03475 [archaeon]